MKQCPNCKNTYTDESLKFCLADGSPLISADDSAKTISMSGVSDETVEIRGAPPTNPVRVDIQKENVPESVATIVAPPFSPQTFQTAPPERKSYGFVVGLLVALLIVVILGFAGFAAYVFFTPQENKTASVSSPTPNATPTADNSANLQEKLANLEKRLEDQKTSPTKTETPVTQMRTARANSPADGFLALRSLPNTETGTRLAKIPHGARFTVLSCPSPTNAGKIKGRWCRVNYEGVEGWAFDAYMIFD